MMAFFCSYWPRSRWKLWASLVQPLVKSLDRKSTRLNSSHLVISYAVFCLKKKKNNSCRLPYLKCPFLEELVLGTCLAAGSTAPSDALWLLYTDFLMTSTQVNIKRSSSFCY